MNTAVPLAITAEPGVACACYLMHHLPQRQAGLRARASMFTLAEILMPVELNCICRSVYNAKFKNNSAEQVLDGKLECCHHEGCCTAQKDQSDAAKSF